MVKVKRPRVSQFVRCSVPHPSLWCRSRQAPDGASRSGRSRQSPVAGQQFTAETLGESNVGRVVRGHVRAQFVRATHQWKRGKAIDVDGLQIADRDREPALGDRAGEPSPSQHRDGVNIDEIRCRDVAGGSDFRACSLPVGRVIADCVCEDRGVDDDQRRTRSAARSSAARAKPTLPPRCRSIRSSTSSRLGRAARRLNSVARYCCSDCPRCSARRCSAECTSSGTSRTSTFGMLTICYHRGL
jgi:hypothetical protein